MSAIKGSHYRSALLYNALDLLKRGRRRDQRFRIAERFIRPGDSVLDVCAGPGRLKRLLSKDCAYSAIEASPEFCAALRKKGAEAIQWNLHDGWPPSAPFADVLVMVISLSQFRETSVHGLLERFKKAARRVVIVEEVLLRSRKEGSLLQRCVNYLSATAFYIPVRSWYTHPEFGRLMGDHGYRCEDAGSRYRVGLYGFQDGMKGEEGPVT